MVCPAFPPPPSFLTYLPPRAVAPAVEGVDRQGRPVAGGGVGALLFCCFRRVPDVVDVLEHARAGGDGAALAARLAETVGDWFVFFLRGVGEVGVKLPCFVSRLLSIRKVSERKGEKRRPIAPALTTGTVSMCLQATMAQYSLFSML